MVHKDAKYQFKVFPYDISRTFQGNSYNPSKNMFRWNNIIDTPMEDWKYIFTLPYGCTISEKLRNFEYKLFNRILPTNSFLFKIKIKDDKLCTFC